MVLWLYLIVVLVEREHPYDRKEVDHDDAKKSSDQDRATM